MKTLAELNLMNADNFPTIFTNNRACSLLACLDTNPDKD